MPSLRILYDVEGWTYHTQALVLRKYAPPDFEVLIASLPRPEDAPIALGDTPVDVVFLLGESNTKAVRETLRQRGWRSKLVAAWCHDFPHGIELFNRVRFEADAWIFNNQTTWETTGRLPRTFMIPNGVDLDTSEFFRVFGEGLDLERRPRPERLDLSDAVTVFVTTVGAPTFERCLRYLRDQDCTFGLQIIDHVAPMNVAFQRMLDECRTPYYVQVDEDMLLHPHAVRTLYESIVGAGTNVAIHVAELYDVHVERCIQGVKIFRHDIVRRYPFTAKNAFESEQVTRLEQDGYVVRRTVCGVHPIPGRTLGLHGTQWSSQSIYERYATLEQSRRARPSRLQWFAPYATEFLRRFSDEPTEENFFALMGVIAGVLASQNGEPNAKDWRTYSSLPGFDALRQFLREVGPPDADRGAKETG